MTKIEINIQMLRSALRRHHQVGQLKHSFMRGDRNIIGFLGEELFLKIRPQSKFCDTYDFDFLSNNQRIDVKTRICVQQPKPNFELAIHLAKKQYDCDFYVFCGVHSSFEYGWVFGYLSKEEFMKNAAFHEAGSQMPQGGKYKSSCHVILLSQMKKL